VGRAGVGFPKPEATQRIILAAMHAAEADAASLGVWDPRRQVLRAILNVGDLAEWEEEWPEDEVYEADQSTWLAGMSEGLLGAVLCLDDHDLAPDDREYLLSLGKHSSISVPLLYAGQWWGELFVSRADPALPFTVGDLDWVSAVAAQVSAALEGVDHVARVEQLAQTDSMTGLANRRALDQWLDSAMVALRTQGTPIGLCVVDLNGLKRINDDQGHDAGDRVLQQLGDILLDASAGFEHTIVARLGGDEFCIAVSGPDAAGIVDAATEVCRHGWAALPHGIAAGVVSTTDAIGAVDASARLFRLADAAQYRAKRLRSRLPVVAGRPLPPELAVTVTVDQDEAVPDRRLLRGREESTVGHLTDAALRALDQARHEPVRTRLAMVADLVTHHVDAIGWWLSLVPAGADALSTVDFALYRRSPDVDPDELRRELSGDFALATYPQTQLALAGASYTVTTTDAAADPAELAILDGLGASGVVAAGGRDAEGDGWLVEVFLDELSGAGQEIAGVLRLFVLAALHPLPL
jgi:diguanylate cyclase (GGDEF)-like protein